MRTSILRSFCIRKYLETYCKLSSASLPLAYFSVTNINKGAIIEKNSKERINLMLKNSPFYRLVQFLLIVQTCAILVGGGVAATTEEKPESQTRPQTSTQKTCQKAGKIQQKSQKEFSTGSEQETPIYTVNVPNYQQSLLSPLRTVADGSPQLSLGGLPVQPVPYYYPINDYIFPWLTRSLPVPPNNSQSQSYSNIRLIQSTDINSP